MRSKITLEGQVKDKVTWHSCTSSKSQAHETKDNKPSNDVRRRVWAQWNIHHRTVEEIRRILGLSSNVAVQEIIRECQREEMAATQRISYRAGRLSTMPAVRVVARVQ